jgi:hypothetical protein
MFTDGYLKKKNWLTPGIRIAHKRPIVQARKVDAGMVVSSVLATADRTSGYGDSSSSATAVGSKLGSSVSPERSYGCVRWVDFMKGQKKVDLETAEVLRGVFLEVIGPLLFFRERHWYWLRRSHEERAQLAGRSGATHGQGRGWTGVGDHGIRHEFMLGEEREGMVQRMTKGSCCQGQAVGKPAHLLTRISMISQLKKIAISRLPQTRTIMEKHH